MTLFKKFNTKFYCMRRDAPRIRISHKSNSRFILKSCMIASIFAYNLINNFKKLYALTAFLDYF